MNKITALHSASDFIGVCSDCRALNMNSLKASLPCTAVKQHPAVEMSARQRTDVRGKEHIEPLLSWASATSSVVSASAPLADSLCLSLVRVPNQNN